MKANSLPQWVWSERSFIAALAALFIAILALYTQHKEPNLTATAIGTFSDPNISFKDERTGPIIYNGSYSILLFLRNNGSAAVTPEDFITPLSIVLPKDLKVIAATQFKAGVDQLTKLKINENIAKIEKILINPNDEIIISINAGLTNNTTISPIDRFKFWEKFYNQVRLVGEIKNLPTPSITFPDKSAPSTISLSWQYKDVGSMYKGTELVWFGLLSIALFHMLGRVAKRSLIGVHSFATHNIHAIFLLASILGADSIYHFISRPPPWNPHVFENYAALFIYVFLMASATLYNIRNKSNTNSIQEHLEKQLQD